MKRSLFVVVIFFAQLIGLRQLAQAAGSPCNSPNGSLFNLEPRPNAVVQVARSLAVLPNPGGKQSSSSCGRRCEGLRRRQFTHH